MKLKILAFICCSFLGTAMFAKGKEVDVNFSERQKAITELSALAGAEMLKNLRVLLSVRLRLKFFRKMKSGNCFCRCTHTPVFRAV